MSINVLGIASSMRQNSSSTRVLKNTLKVVEKNGGQIQLLDLRETQLPLYSPGRKESTELQKAIDNVKWADAFILASPDYHGSMSGVMKNFLDYFWTDFAGKTFGYICASHEKGLTVMDQMRTAIRQCYGWSMPYGLSVNSELDFDKDGNVSNSVKTRIEMLGRDLVIYGSLISKQFKEDLKSDKMDTFAAHYR